MVVAPVDEDDLDGPVAQHRAADSPPKPPPTMTTRCTGGPAVGGRPGLRPAALVQHVEQDEDPRARPADTSPEATTAETTVSWPAAAWSRVRVSWRA